LDRFVDTVSPSSVHHLEAIELERREKNFWRAAAQLRERLEDLPREVFHTSAIAHGTSLVYFHDLLLLLLLFLLFLHHFTVVASSRCFAVASVFNGGPGAEADADARKRAAERRRRICTALLALIANPSQWCSSDPTYERRSHVWRYGTVSTVRIIRGAIGLGSKLNSKNQ